MRGKAASSYYSHQNIGYHKNSFSPWYVSLCALSAEVGPLHQKAQRIGYQTHHKASSLIQILDTWLYTEKVFW